MTVESIPDYKFKYGFVGGGNMGEAIIKGLVAGGFSDPGRIAVFDTDQGVLARLEQDYKTSSVRDNKELVQSSSIVVLAIKPQQIKDVLSEIGGLIVPAQLVISIAAGVTLADLQSGLLEPAPVIRVVPNTPALVRAGATALTAGAHAGKEHMDEALALFEGVGTVVQVEEKYMDIITGLAGSGPAYVFTMIEALADGAVRMGLPRRLAYNLAGQTVMGAAKLCLESGKHPGELKDNVVSPGGTTAAGLYALEKGAFRSLLIEAVGAAAQRAEELGKK